MKVQEYFQFLTLASSTSMLQVSSIRLETTPKASLASCWSLWNMGAEGWPAEVHGDG